MSAQKQMPTYLNLMVMAASTRRVAKLQAFKTTDRCTSVSVITLSMNL